MDEATLERCAEYIEGLYAPESETMRWVRGELEDRGLPLIHVSPLVGRLLAVLAALAGARRLLEIGTLGGYSGLWLLSLLPDDARLVTLEKEPAHAELAREAMARAGENGRAEIRLGDARETLEDLTGRATFDVVFIDADKESYPSYLELTADLVGPGGLLLADNTLWRGRVTDPAAEEEGARAIQAFNRALAEDARFDALILPVRDGLTVARRRG
jgi:caffeoyl-CoA O-methyltransferase